MPGFDQHQVTTGLKLWTMLDGLLHQTEILNGRWELHCHYCLHNLAVQAEGEPFCSIICISIYSLKFYGFLAVWLCLTRISLHPDCVVDLFFLSKQCRNLCMESSTTFPVNLLLVISSWYSDLLCTHCRLTQWLVLVFIKRLVFASLPTDRVWLIYLHA
jgi:hypothetical protein